MHLLCLISKKKILSSYFFMSTTLSLKSNLLPQSIHGFLFMIYLTGDKQYHMTGYNYYNFHIHKTAFLQQKFSCQLLKPAIKRSHMTSEKKGTFWGNRISIHKCWCLK